MDRQKIQQGVELMLEGLGIDRNDKHFIDTPRRVTKAWSEELCAGLQQAEFEMRTFPLGEEDYAGMVVLQHIPVKSICAHHLLPFIGEATIAYIPNRLLCGLSKLSRVTDYFARKPQVQELLTSEIAQFIDKTLNPQGVGVIIKASHMCMEMRGVDHTGLMTTSSLLGSFLDDPTRSEFMALAHSKSLG